MASLEQENQVRTTVKAVLEEMSALRAADLARTDQLGPDLSFESGVVFFSRTLRLFHALKDVNLDDVPFQRLTQISQVATETRDRFRNIRDFSLTKYANNPIGTRDGFINSIRDSYDQVFEVIAPVIAYSIRKGTDFERLEEQAKAALEKVDKISEEHVQSLRKAQTDADEILAAVRKLAQEAGVSQHAIHFKSEADQHETSAGKWLRATMLLTVLTFATTIVFWLRYFDLVPTYTAAQNVQLAVSKVLLVSLLVTATLWAGKTYRSHRHNAVVNRHRQNALATFQAFAKAASDDATKNAVLLQATQCIFAPQHTGYIQGDHEAGVPQVLEIVRDIGKSN